MADPVPGSAARRDCEIGTPASDCPHVNCMLHRLGEGGGRTTWVPGSVASLARESLYTVEQWQHALNALGSHAPELLPTVQHYMTRQGITPYAAALVVLSAVGEEPDRG